jgi:branched-chain amino acid transport system permease protein
MADFLQTLETVIAVGSLYALIALGYTMVYGILKFINFAHSDVVVLGAWLSYKLAVNVLPPLGIDPYGDVPWWTGGVILLVAMVACGIVGFGIERLCYRPLRRSPRLNVLITAIGVSLFLQNFGQLNFVFGKTPQAMPTLISTEPLLRFSAEPAPEGAGDGRRFLIEGYVPGRGLTKLTGWKLSGNPADEWHLGIPIVDVVIFVTAGVLMLLLELLVYRTKLGTAMRAVSFNTETAPLMGIDVDRVISITFVIGSMLAAAAGFLSAVKYGSVQQPAQATWVLLGLKAFVAAVIGGIGNLRGAVLGGFLIAFVEQMSAFYISSSLKDFFVFTLLILMLLVKPTGLLGSPIREKV